VVEFLIVGSENIAGSRIIVPVAFATVIAGVVLPVTGTVVTQGTISVGTVVAQIGTVAVSTVTSVVALGTIQNAPMVTVQGTVTAAISATLEVGTIVVGVEGSVVVATILNSPMVTVQGTVTTGDMGTVVIGTVLSPVNVGSVTNIGFIGTLQKVFSMAILPFSPGFGTLGTIVAPVALAGGGTLATRSYGATTNVNANATVTASVAATLVAATLQNLVVDAVFGTMYPTAGSVQVAVLGLEPQTSLRTSTVGASAWYSGTVPAALGYHGAFVGPLGQNVVVSLNMVTGTAVGVGVTAQQSSWG